MKTKRGFTLIELLVVIAIIGLLSSVVFASLNSARMKARDARRLADLKEMQKALALYADDHGGKYPVNTNGTGLFTAPGGGVDWVGTTPGCYNFTGNNAPMAGYLDSSGAYKADPLSPKYIPTLPQDPKPVVNNGYCYLYISSPDGKGFKFLVYTTVESFDPRTTGHPMADMTRPNSFSIWEGINW